MADETDGDELILYAEFVQCVAPHLDFLDREELETSSHRPDGTIELESSSTSLPPADAGADNTSEEQDNANETNCSMEGKQHRKRGRASKANAERHSTSGVEQDVVSKLRPDESAGAVDGQHGPHGTATPVFGVNSEDSESIDEVVTRKRSRRGVPKAKSNPRSYDSRLDDPGKWYHTTAEAFETANDERKRRLHHVAAMLFTEDGIRARMPCRRCVDHALECMVYSVSTRHRIGLQAPTRCAACMGPSKKCEARPPYEEDESGVELEMREGDGDVTGNHVLALLAEVSALRDEMAGMREEVSDVHDEMASMRREIRGLRSGALPSTYDASLLPPKQTTK
ncbi:hypothetical protein LTR86_010648 [Recurvomyces mirabilis]|nr:hypothetical protein LTR86_010648 [Recurvomyces mirabilis]